MIFITGFARGGTSWLRDCIAFHPDVKAIPHEMVIFNDRSDRQQIESEVQKAIADNDLSSPRFVNKAPANAPNINNACSMFPESKFLFIIRDPRDVFVSHKRGAKAWMGGRNSTVKGCMKKIGLYWQGYESAAQQPNIKIVRYEDLHQSFATTLKDIYKFLELPYDAELIQKAFESLNFQAQAGRRQEDRNAARRKGVIGDWANFLSTKELDFYKTNSFWKDFLEQQQYRQEPITYERILNAMHEAGVNCLSQDDVLNLKLAEDRPNLFILHDIDFLNSAQARNSIIDCAKIEAQFGFSGMYDFLPLDDPRYNMLSEDAVMSLINSVKKANPETSIGLHLNVTEKFFPKDMPEMGEDHPDMSKAIEYLHQQIEKYKHNGLEFRMATSHGYGRGKKSPTNQSEVFRPELEKHGIHLFEKALGRKILKKACHDMRIHDVGGALTIKRFQNCGQVDDPETYRRFCKGSLILILVHPGNYDMQRHLTLGFRQNSIGICNKVTMK